MKRKRVYSVCLAAALVLTGIFTSEKMPSVSAAQTADTSDLEAQRQETQDRIDDIKSDIKAAEDKIDALENSKSSLQSYISQLDREANDLEQKIQELNGEIENKEEEVEQAKLDLEEAVEVADQQYEDMKMRIRYLYENGTPSMLELLLTSQSFADFLNRSTYASQMTSYDRQMLDEYIAQKEAVEQKKAELELEEEELRLLADAAAEQKEAVESLISAKNAEIASYQAQIDSESSNADAYEKDLAEQERLLDQIEQQIAAAAAAAAQEGDGDGGASGFIWPCPSSHRITSNFGPRPQPTAGASTNHKGIDIGAGYGSAIVASASGRVTTSTYSSSAGNYIVISHGNGMSTVYMHCSALYVSVGQMVTQGETIAAVGSTGYSTGNHLHFGVIKNGTYVNPLNYVG